MAGERKEPAIDLGRLAQLLARFRDVDGALLPILHAVQEEYGYVPPETVAPIAKFLRATAPQIYSVLTFYSEFRTKPRAEKVIGICRGPACRLSGGKALQQGLERDLGIRAGESTADGKVTLETVSCLGICGLAPAAEAGHDLVGRADLAALQKALSELDK